MSPLQKVTKPGMALWIGTLIMLLAAWLRLGAFHEALVGADQSSILAAASNIASFRDLPLVGIKSSIGVMQTAITPYLAAIPLLLVRRVIAVKWFFSVLDLLALALLYRAAKRVFGPWAAGIAALLYAANPWVVEFVRWIWYQTLISTFATIAFAAFLLLVAENKRESSPVLIPLGMVAAVLMGMVHLAALPWAALLVVLAAYITWRTKRWGWFLTGVGLSLVVVSPYLIYLIKTGFADVRLIMTGGGDAAPTWNWATYRLAGELLTGRQVFATPRDPLWEQSVVRAPLLYWIVPVTLGLALLSAVWRFFERREIRLAWVFTFAWAFFAPTLFLITRIHLQHFYLLFMFPAPYVLIGVGMQNGLLSTVGTLAKWRRWLGRCAVAALLVLALWWTYIWTVRIGFEDQGLLRAPTRAWLMDVAVERIADYLASEPEGNVILLTTFEGGDLSAFDWIRSFVHSDRVRVVPAGEGFIIPSGPTCYMLTPGASELNLQPVATIVAEQSAMRVPASPPWPSYCTAARAQLPTPLAEWQNGMSLLNVVVTEALEPGAYIDITLTWHYRVVAPKEYHIFNHLLLNETLIAQIDGAGVPTWYWRDDDVLVTRFRMELPPNLTPGTYRLITGSYTWPDVERVLLTNGEAAYEVWRWEN